MRVRGWWMALYGAEGGGGGSSCFLSAEVMEKIYKVAKAETYPMANPVTPFPLRPAGPQ